MSELRREGRTPPRPPHARFPQDPNLDRAFAEVYARISRDVVTAEELGKLIQAAIDKHVADYH